MNDYEDINKSDQDYNSTVVYFEGLVERMYRSTKTNRSTKKSSGFKNAVKVEERM